MSMLALLSSYPVERKRLGSGGGVPVLLLADLGGPRSGPESAPDW